MASMVEAGPVRAHVQYLIDQGMTQAAIYQAARTSSAALSALLYGQFKPGRPAQQHISADVAARLLAVRFEKPAPKPLPLCAPGTRFEPVGYQGGRCQDCGQIAPLYIRPGMAVMIRHPRPEPDAQALDTLPLAASHAHPDCGSPRGVERHKRERTAVCEPCRAARRGYEQGMTAGLAKAARVTKAAEPPVSPELTEAVVKAMRAFLFRRPLPQLQELARTVVRAAADAEFAIDDERAVA